MGRRPVPAGVLLVLLGLSACRQATLHPDSEWVAASTNEPEIMNEAREHAEELISWSDIEQGAPERPVRFTRGRISHDVIVLE